uniref:AAA+ ATPase domain-containing protein n=1 Tax=Fagus sylvatica TaxID=28930 RepID=A0A2N9FDV1_FAGSY
MTVVHSPCRHESTVIQDIVGVILKRVSPPFLVEDLVGLDSRVEEINSYLRIGLNDVHMIGICGMGGIGKTTIAKVVYERLSDQFEGSSFLSNVRVVTKGRGLICLQEKLLSDILMVRDIRILSVQEGVNLIRKRLHRKKILLVLDDVDRLDQLEILAGNCDWFGPGTYMEMSHHFVNYAAGLPLAIEVLGSFLFNRSITEWEKGLKMGKEHSLRQVLDVLQISFDGLEETEREMFLHIACFFNGEDKDRVVEILDCLGYHAEFGLHILINKSLLRVLSDNRLWMHDLLQIMGWQMVRRECAIEPGKRSRLWLLEDVNNVLTENMGTEAVQGIVLDLPIQKEAHWNPEAFLKMFNVRLLKIQNVQLPHGLTHFPSALRFVEWNGTPDFTGVPNLVRIDLEGCTNLVEVHPSIGVLRRLIFLNLKDCKCLRSLPNKIEMESLEILMLSGCSKVKKIPEFAENMQQFRELSLNGTAIKKLPSSIKHLTGLTLLNLRDCKNLVCLPSGVYSLKSLRELVLSGCSKLVESQVHDILHTHEPEIELTSYEKVEFLSARGKEVVETSNEKGLSILETEIETVPSQTEDGQRKSKMSMHVGEAIELPTPVSVSTSGTSERAVVEPMTIPPSRKKMGSQPINDEEIEIPCQTDSQQLLGQRRCAMRSIERTVGRILAYMSNNKSRRIGIHGSGGIGKTSVLKALINYPKTKYLFDVNIWVTVSRNWSMRKIQDEVLRQLSLSPADSKTDSEIAKKLFQALKSQRFLLLLDDVWEQIDLHAIGIPDPTLENGCRMIIATRSVDVCCIKATDIEVQVERLLEEEAWELFREQVAWRHASKEFSWCSEHGMYGFESIIQQLKFSYDRLEGLDLKGCFLYCALFPEDWEVSIFDLVGYWIHEGLISGNWTDAYKRGHDIVNILLGASLLQISEDTLSIKMHDLIRDLASGILSLEAEGCQFMLRNYSRITQLSDTGNSSSYRSLESFEGNRQSILESRQFLSRAAAGLTEPPLKEEWEEAKLIFFMDNELSRLPERPSCPNLLALFLQRNHNLRVIPSSFFDLMPFLKVLNLSKTRIKFLPKSLSKLMSLEVLVLRKCECLVLLPSEVGSLRRLEVLDLQGTEIEKLPDEISELASLRHLNESFYGSVNWSEYAKLPHELVSNGIISSLHNLEMLSIDVYPGDRRWDKNVKSIINEVGNLTKLINFSFYFPKVEFLELFLQTSLSGIQGLTKFKFVVGHDVKRFVSQVVDNLEFDFVQWGQCLRFINGEIIPDAVVEVLTCATAFYLDHHINVCSLSEFGVSNFTGLRFCVIRECPKIQTVIASKELSEAVFPILEHLSINYLSNFYRISEGMIPQGSFAKLRILTIQTCPKFQFVFACSMLQIFSNLEELIVEDCPAIEEIIFQDQVVDSGSDTLPSLKRLKLHYLPRLVNIMKGAWPPLESISFYDCPRLKKLGIDSNTCHTLTEIKAENDWWEDLDLQDTLRLPLQARFTPICDNDL